MASFKLTLSYDGTRYSGWQCQPGQPTLQQTLEQTLAKITGDSLRVMASGRTDAGVHALAQVVSFTSQTRLAAAELQKALNAELPRDMAVLELSVVPDGFDANRCAIKKRYRYQIDDGPVRDVFANDRAWFQPAPLDAAAMHRAGRALVGTHDFSSFETSGSPRESSVRTVFDLTVARGQGSGAGRVTVEVEADGFLYNMVRAIVGTLVDVGRGVQHESWLAEVLAARDRRAAGRTAPAHGLYLVRVDYGPEWS